MSVTCLKCCLPIRDAGDLLITIHTNHQHEAIGISFILAKLFGISIFRKRHHSNVFNST